MLQWFNINIAIIKKPAIIFGTSLAVLFCFFSLLSPRLARAQEAPATGDSVREGVQAIEQPLGLPATDIRIIISRIIRYALGFLGIIFLIIVLYGGVLWMTAGGNDEKVVDAKKVLINGVIGLAIILSAYAIVLFVMRILGIQEGGAGGSGGGGGGLGQINFVGSGALGGVIKDHYPSRNQTDVPRNTKIMITFRRPIAMESIAEDTNKSGQLGDCINIGQNLNWAKDCDALRIDPTRIAATPVASGTPMSGAAILASADPAGKVLTIVIRPYSALGSETEKAKYTVRVGKEVRLDDSANGNPSIFKNAPAGSDFYEWQYTYSTELDSAPPVVKSVFPANNAAEAKNSVIQADFSEAMDPIGLQGSFQAGTNYYFIQGNSIFLKSGKSAIPQGTIALTNGFRTLEFTSSLECGVNACGAKIFCLPVCDNCVQDSYQMLLRAATTLGSNSFEAVPFSGVADASGNALDGNKDGKVQTVTPTLPIFSAAGVAESQEQPDNFYWSFTLKNEIDATAPYLSEVYPGLDAQNIKADEEWRMTFSKRMRIDPMYDITIDQSPAPANGVGVCKAPRVTFSADGTTVTAMEHCPFLDGTRTYYYPTVPSTVEDAHYNCFYPGKGPNDVIPAGSVQRASKVCAADGTSCCAVTTDPTDKPYCCNGVPSANGGKECVSRLK